MTGAELTMMIIHYPDIEIKAFDPVTGEFQPISAQEVLGDFLVFQYYRYGRQVHAVPYLLCNLLVS